MTTTVTPMRQRILDAATELFYTQGLRAVSAERVIERVGITKVTFYRYFRTKDDLIVAYLERRAEREREGTLAARDHAAGDVDATLRLISEGIGAEACSPGFRGCPFINAAAEFADPAHPVRQVVDTHRAWWKAMLEELVGHLGLPDPATVADELIIARDGALVTGYLGDPATVAPRLYAISQTILAAHTR
ncbi:TetR/AcrR family transcriptional regulator [Actinoplanes palleronii]|uniref:TetR family transcriptional regulator n=1 Tax=Actinoplanes palleronii TaxID=113570 RepID=A0ABQ4B135_9ACTN|nr:TetR/AcrR family transcriptional regulator [Actinoplanes palleronii]GIE64374.1 TetR family transcriptional regulator [Actinoplanes palleronii]